jgi:hypothetical protein
VKSVLAFCPGQTLVGFGGRVTGGAGQVHLTDLSFFTPPSITEFFAREDANGFDGLWSATSYTVCADAAAGFTSVFASSPASSENKSASVSCPPGTQVHSAGGVLIAGASAPLSSLLIDKVSIDPSLSSITVNGVEDETGTDDNWTATAVALCAP